MAGKSTGGYSAIIIHDNDKERFKCMLCLDIIKSATHGCMNHVFCKECINDYIDCNKNKELLLCPAGCGISFDKEKLQSSKPVDQFVNTIACKCPDCSWNGELYDYIQQHEVNCEEKKVQCELCAEVVKKKDLEVHVVETCRNRNISCIYCLGQFRYVDYDEHETACGNSEIECFYKKFGCTETIRRKSINTHNERSNQKHLFLVTTHFSEENEILKNANRDLQSANEALKSSNIDLALMVTICDSNNEALKKSFEIIDKSLQAVKDENKTIIEMLSQLKCENIALKDNLSAISLKVLKHLELSKQTVKKVLEIDEGLLVIKKCNLSFSDIKTCFDKQSFSRLTKSLIEVCNDLRDYEYELKELISTSCIIKFCDGSDTFLLFFKIDNFTRFKDDSLSLKKVEKKYYFEWDSDVAVLSLSKWDIHLTKKLIDLSKPDERFKLSPEPFTTDRYGCLWWWYDDNEEKDSEKDNQNLKEQAICHSVEPTIERPMSSATSMLSVGKLKYQRQEDDKESNNDNIDADHSSILKDPHRERSSKSSYPTMRDKLRRLVNQSL